MTTVTEYEAEALKGVPLLGSLCWYHLNETVRVEHGKFTNLANLYGFSDGIPPSPEPRDVFMRVCSEAQRKRVDAGTPGLFANFLVRNPSARGDDPLVRRIVRETVDTRGKVLTFDELVDLRWFRTTRRIEAVDLRSGDEIDFTLQTDDVAQNMAREINVSFRAWLGHMHHYTVRQTLRRFMEVDLRAVMVRSSGGVYFVPQTYRAQLENLRGLTEALDGVEFHTVPLVDIANQRELIRNAFENEATDTIVKILNEMADARAKGTKMTESRCSELLATVSGINGRMKEYRQMLGDKLETAQAQLDLLQAAALEALNQVTA